MADDGQTLHQEDELVRYVDTLRRWINRFGLCSGKKQDDDAPILNKEELFDAVHSASVQCIFLETVGVIICAFSVAIYVFHLEDAEV